MQFQYPVVQELFKKDFRISREVISEIKALDLAVEADLLQIIDDALQNTDYYEELEASEGGFAPLHAILLLREIKSTKILPKILEMLRGDILEMDRLFSPDFLIEEVWSYIAHLGQNQLKDFKEILFEGNADVYARTAISTGLAQMALHHPKYAEKVFDVFDKLLDFILSEESLEYLDNKEGIFGDEPDYDADIEFISNFACDLLDLDYTEKRKELEALFENGLIDEEILEESKAVFKRNQMKSRDIFEIYTDWEISEKTATEEDDDDEDEPKIKKMKD
ncbi:MAG: DUF1186 domain-containing protein [Thermonemataceae bacterium]|nr:DUF1186 domain-containing protein [Thermonemataceae bacterium]